MTTIEEYYNKFNEEKRLNTRHGRVEFITSMKYIHKYIDILKDELKAAGKEAVVNSDIRILDIGAGTGRYSVPLVEEGFDVSAVELVKHNLGRLKQKSDKVKAYQGNAMKLKRFEDNSFDLTLLFGPMYHLHAEEDKLKALSEAKRVTRDGGIILVAYIMNEYSVVRKHSVRHYKDKFIKISQKIYFVYLFFRVSGTNVPLQQLQSRFACNSGLNRSRIARTVLSE